MSDLQPLTYVFILVIVFCGGWCGSLWWMRAAIVSFNTDLRAMLDGQREIRARLDVLEIKDKLAPKENAKMIELKDKSVATLVEMDEPEALLETIRRTAARKTGKRWQALTTVLDEASLKLDQLLDPKPERTDFRPEPHDSPTEAA